MGGWEAVSSSEFVTQSVVPFHHPPSETADGEGECEADGIWPINSNRPCITIKEAAELLPLKGQCVKFGFIWFFLYR